MHLRVFVSRIIAEIARAVAGRAGEQGLCLSRLVWTTAL